LKGKKNQLNDAKIDLVEGQTFCKGMSGDFTRMTCSVPNAYQPMTMRVHLYQPCPLIMAHIELFFTPIIFVFNKGNMPW